MHYRYTINNTVNCKFVTLHDRPPQSPAGIVQRLKSCYSSATIAAASV